METKERHISGPPSGSDDSWNLAVQLCYRQDTFVHSSW